MIFLALRLDRRCKVFVFYSTVETSSDFEGTLTVTNKDCNERPQVKQGICLEV